MTAQADIPVTLVPRTELDAAAADDVSTRMLGTARQLFLHGLAVLAAAILLGIAEALAMWMGALLVAVGLLAVAAVAALLGFIGRLGRRPRR